MRAYPKATPLSALALFALVATLSSSGEAAAGVCSLAPQGVPMGPLPFSWQMGELAQPRRACPRTELVIGGEGQAIVRTEEFYGNLQGNAVLGGSYAVSPRLELFGSLEPLLVQQVISSLQATHIGLGHGAIGATFVVLEQGPVVLSATTRVTLPFAFGLYQNAWPIGLDAGLTGALQPLPYLRGYASVLGSGSFLLSAGDPLPRAGVLMLGGAELILFDWVSLVGEAKALTLYEADLDHLSVSGGLRTRIWDGFGAELYATAPIAGRERSLAGGGLRVSWQL